MDWFVAGYDGEWVDGFKWSAHFFAQGGRGGRKIMDY